MLSLMQFRPPSADLPSLLCQCVRVSVDSILDLLSFDKTLLKTEIHKDSFAYAARVSQTSLFANSIILGTTVEHAHCGVHLQEPEGQLEVTS
eukprot:95785-Amphidinium_carterae.1